MGRSNESEPGIRKTLRPVQLGRSNSWNESECVEHGKKEDTQGLDGEVQPRRSNGEGTREG